VTGGWYKYVLDGAVVGIDTFGESAPAPELFKHFGFTTENVVRQSKASCNKHRRHCGTARRGVPQCLS